MRLTFAWTALLFLFVCGLNVFSEAQTEVPHLQKISLKDKVLEGNLNDYVNITRAKLISISLEKQDSLYRYKVAKIYFFEGLKKHSRLP